MTSFADRARAIRAINRLNGSLNIALPTAERMAEFTGFEFIAPSIATKGNRKQRRSMKP